MIDNIILSHSTRGMDRAYAHFKTTFCKNAAEKFCELEKGNIFIYTGFWVNGMGETDGPIGAYFLYQAFLKLGFKPIILCDDFCDGYFDGCEFLSIQKGEDTKENFEKISQKYNPVAHFSIERCGRDKEGKYKNSSLKDITKFTPKLDTLFMQSSVPTFAIGDGGNEIGLGNFKEFLEEDLHVNPTIVTSDYPILASVSNWGAYGFLAYLQKFLKVKLLPDFSEVEEYLKHIVKCGATEGFSGKNIMQIDGKGYELDADILKELTKAIKL